MLASACKAIRSRAAEKSPNCPAKVELHRLEQCVTLSEIHLLLAFWFTSSSSYYRTRSFAMPQVLNYQPALVHLPHDTAGVHPLVIDVDWRPVEDNVWQATNEEVSQAAGISHYRYYSTHQAGIEYCILEFTSTPRPTSRHTAFTTQLEAVTVSSWRCGLWREITPSLYRGLLTTVAGQRLWGLRFERGRLLMLLLS